MNADLNSDQFTHLMAAALAVGGSLVYIAMLVRYRAQTLPYFFIFGLAIDQLIRAAGNTRDLSLLTDYYNTQIGLTAAALILGLITVYRQSWEQRREGDQPAVQADYALLPFWSGIGLGALLFLELSLLSLPNAIAGRTDADYTSLVPGLMVATLLPLLPFVRTRARGFIGLFDASARGWLWGLLIALLIVFGTRVQSINLTLPGGNDLGSLPVGGYVLIVAQFFVSMMWWWLARPRAEKQRQFSGWWLVWTVLIFALFVAADVFTYEYAFVRDFDPSVEFLNPIVPPLLRGFRALGLALIIFAVFLSVLPMIQTRRRIPWTGGTGWQGLLAMLFIVGMAVGVGYISQPPLIQAVRNVDNLRVATYNIHSGYDELFNDTLEDLVPTIEISGAQVVLLQEVEVGRLTSFGVDQPLWLARELEMDTRFYPANEGIQGLAVLSKVPIVFDDGTPLESVGNQTALQRVQILPDAGVITIYNTWLGLLQESLADRTLAEQEQDQQRQLEEIFTIIARHHRDQNGLLGRTIIGGTFNNIPDSPLIGEMRAAGFVDPFDGLPLELSATLVRSGIRARVDYLWINALQRLSVGVMDSIASDHRLGVVELAITRQSQAG